MASIGNKELARAMWRLFEEWGEMAQPRATYKAALQSIEDEWGKPATQAAFGAAIETAAPGAFTNAQKQKLGDVWMLLRAQERLS